MAMPASAEATATLPVVFITSRRDGLCLGVSVTMDLLPGGKIGGNERATMLSSFSNLRRKSIAEIEKCSERDRIRASEVSFSKQYADAVYQSCEYWNYPRHQRTFPCVYPPATAPTTKNGSTPDATASGRGASGGSRDRSSVQAKKRNIGRRSPVMRSRMVPRSVG